MRVWKIIVLESKEKKNYFYFYLWKESLNSDGQQFHQDQQNEQ